MDGLQVRFDEIVSKIKALPADGPARPPNDLKLKPYGLFRQACDGDVHGEARGLFDMVGKVKHEAWLRHRDMTRDEAMRQYVALAEGFAREQGVAL
ncbi:MAG TPA: acyl-CoA-binding protein [Rhodoblastus sp.]|nr:acyl-CoA-binding protein [Rhodoblastus sp.]